MERRQSFRAPTRRILVGVVRRAAFTSARQSILETNLEEVISSSADRPCGRCSRTPWKPR